MLTYAKRKIDSLSEKSRILLKNSIGAFLVKGSGFVVSLATLPAFISFFGNNAVLGVWYTLLSVLTWINFFDLGIGNGLRNQLVICFSENNVKRAKSLVSSAYAMMGVLSIVFGLALYCAVPLFDWNSFLGIGIDDVDPAILCSSIRWIVVGVVVHFFLKLIGSVIYAIQKSAWVNAVSLFGSVLQLAFVLACPNQSAENGLLLLSRAYVIFSCVPYLLVTIYLFSGKLRNVSPSLFFVARTESRQVLGLGGVFFFCQVLYMFLVGTNEFFITYFFGPSATTDYSVYYKLFSVAGTLSLLALTPVWSLVTKAIAEGSYKWTLALYEKSLKAVWLVFAFEMVLAISFHPIVDVWIGSDFIEGSPAFLAVFVAWGTVFALQSVMSSFVCGLGRMKLQTKFYFAGCVLKVFFIVFVGRFTGEWIIVPLSNVLVLIPYCFAQHIDLKSYLHGKLGCINVQG